MASVETPPETPVLPPAETPLLTPLTEVLQTVNRIRIEYGADPIYELPQGSTAWHGGSSCVLEKAFADLGVLYVDYRYAHGKGVRIEHGLGGFVRDFDAGRFPELVEPSTGSGR
jgi:hypothetical protein